MNADPDSYQSPFSWRYASPEMRAIWGEQYKRRTWRKLWVALAQAQCQLGLVAQAQVDDLKAHQDQVQVARSLEIEADLKHDLMAEVKAFAEQCSLGGGIIHLGATSMDIKDNAEVLLLRQALDLTVERLAALLGALAQRIVQTAELACIGFTHLQPAEPTTLGYRLALYAQDLLIDWNALQSLQRTIKGKGFRGAVGTGASYIELLGKEQYETLEQLLAESLELEFFTATHQTYPRKQDYQIVSALADLAGSLYRMAFDLRILQSPVIGEVSEPFGVKQVGSSAMPFKRNPVTLEAIDSLARALSQMPKLAWDNAAHSLLERTLDDSANRRTLLPEAFLIADEILLKMTGVVQGLQINPEMIRRNLEAFTPFAATERLLMALVKQGADRQVAHEKIRELSLVAWGAVQRGQKNPLQDRLVQEPYFQNYLSTEQIESLMNVDAYLGLAPQKALQIAAHIQTATAVS